MVSCAGVIAAAIDLADDQQRGVVILNRARALSAAADGGAAARGIRDLYEERFIRFDQRVAVYSHVESVSGLTRGDRLARQAARDIVAAGKCSGAVLGGDIESDSTRRRW